jgi:hypothetical protein
MESKENKQIYYYEVGYSSYEECPNSTLCHVNLYTKDEFYKMVVDCFVLASNDDEKRWNKMEDDPSWTEEEKDMYKYRPSITSLYSGVIYKMISEYGFYSPAITQTFCVSGDESIVVDQFYREINVDEELGLLRERFNIIEPRDKKISNIIDK